MSALYIHIPFCKQACHYCDFHFSTKIQNRSAVIEAIVREIFLQKNYLKNTHLRSIYFGGGTPSLLSKQELNMIFEEIAKYFSWDNQTEITLEANPDDLSLEKIKILKSLDINRLSIGIQSFNEGHLRYLNRVHSSENAKDCVQIAQNEGITNISIDLIYAIPAQTHEIWMQDLQIALNLNVSHISAYSLTIEPFTVFGNWLEKGKIKAIDDDFSAEQFEILLQKTKEKGYLQYEISSFCLPDQYSRHNSNYWKQSEYLGVGASAHSYNGKTRQFNVSNNQKYIKALQSNEIPCEIETLTWKDKINEYVFTTLRTIWGCDLTYLRKFSEIDFEEHNKAILQKYKQSNILIEENHILYLTENGKLFVDEVSKDLFLE